MNYAKKAMAAAALLAMPVLMTSCEDILGHWEKPAPEVTLPSGMLDTPLTLEAAEAGATVTFKFCEGLSGPVEYSTDYTTWHAYTSSTPVTLENVGDKVSFRGNNPTYYNSEASSSKASKLKCDKVAYVYGNIMSLITPTSFATNTTLTGHKAFGFLFSGSEVAIHHLKNHPDATKTLELPAKTLTEECYFGMFEYTDLTIAPKLPATTMVKDCYRQMFLGCSSLITPPELPATALAKQCYGTMFYECTSLETAPELPATTLAEWCYSYMFYKCTSLTTAPKLPATELVENCYGGMFSNCTHLNEAWVKADYAAGNSECKDMFNNCASSGTLHTATTSTHWVAGTDMPNTWTVEKNY